VNRTKAVVAGALIAGFCITLSVSAASEDIPELKFYLDQELVSTRNMTSSEFDKWQELQKVSRDIKMMVLPTAEMGKDIANQSDIIARMGLRVASNALRRLDGSQPAAEEEAIEHKLKALTATLKLKTKGIEQEADTLEQYARLVEQRVDDFRNEITRESSSIRFDRVHVNEQESYSSIDFY
jgi:hypothetical protein